MQIFAFLYNSTFFFLLSGNKNTIELQLMAVPDEDDPELI